MFFKSGINGEGLVYITVCGKQIQVTAFYSAICRCDCTPGYTGVLCDIEVNECDSLPCSNNAICEDMVADFLCTCQSGFGGRHCDRGKDII